MKQAIFLLLLLSGLGAKAQNLGYYQWRPVIPGITCDDSIKANCSIWHLVPDTQRDVLWILGTFKGGDTITSPEMMGFDGVKYVDISTLSSQSTNPKIIRDAVMYKGKIAIAYDQSLRLFDPDSLKTTTIATLPTGGSSYFKCLGVYKDNLVAGGLFGTIKNATSGSVNTISIALWDGNKWNSLGGGLGGSVYIADCIKEYHDKLYVGGSFQQAGGVDAWNIASWNDTTWECLCKGTGKLGTGYKGTYNWDGRVFDMEVINDKLYAVGDYDSLCNYETYLGYWDGAQWTPTSYPFYYNRKITSFKGIPVIESLDNQPWPWTFWNNAVATQIDSIRSVYSICSFQDTLYAGGPFDSAGSTQLFRFAKLVYDSISISTGTTPDKFTTLNIYPNPATSQLTVSSNQLADAEIELHDLYGRLIKQIKTTLSPTVIDVKPLKNGVFFLYFKTQDGVVVRKFVKG